MPPLENLRIEAPLRENGGSRGAGDHAAAERAPTPSDNVRMRGSAAAASGAAQPTNRRQKMERGISKATENELIVNAARYQVRSRENTADKY